MHPSLSNESIFFPQPSGHLDSTDNDVFKGSSHYMAPEIFEQECLREFQYQKQKLKKEKQSNTLSSTPAASTPACATPTRMTAITPLAASTPMAASLKEQALKNNNRRDIWAFGCVLYELATHRLPWYHKIEASSTFSDGHSSELPQTAADPQTFFKNPTFWRNLGEFHGGTQVFFHIDVFIRRFF
jgi:serine/threonine protein kinase